MNAVAGAINGANGDVVKRSRQYAEQLRKRIVGLCYYGGCRSARVGMEYCQKHRDYVTARQRVRRRKIKKLSK